MSQDKQESVETCILSMKGLQRSGYSVVYFEGKSWPAHRLAYKLAHGRIPKGKIICHKCDVRNCINPKHLYAGTYKDNSNDCFNRKRHIYLAHPERLARGERVNTAKLDQSDIKKILKLRHSKSWPGKYKVAKQFGVGATTIQDIVSKTTWRHINV